MDLCNAALLLSYPQSLNLAQCVKSHSAAALPSSDPRKPPEIVGAILTIIRHFSLNGRVFLPLSIVYQFAILPFFS